MIDEILIPMDLSASEYNVIKYGSEVANSFGSRVILLHAYALPQPAPHAAGTGGFTYIPQRDPIDEYELREAKMKELLKEAPALEKVDHELIVQQGTISDVITEHLTKSGTQLVVMGTGGAKGVGELLGTVAERVTREATCPVLVIPGNYPYKPLEKISLAVDSEGIQNNPPFDVLREFVKSFRTSLDVIHVHENNKDAEEVHHTINHQLNDVLDGAIKPKTFRTILSTDVEKGLSDFVHQHDIDLLALIYREHGFFKRLFNPGVRTKMVYHSDTPLLVLK